MWKRKKEIEGVSSSSIITLKSIIANEERELKKLQEDGIKIGSKQGFNIKQLKKTPLQNKGVNDRNQRDLEQQEPQSDEDYYLKSHKSLIEKSKIYENRLNKDPFNSEEYRNEHEENEVIDFREKSYLKFKEQQEIESQKQQQISNIGINKYDYIPEGMYHPDFEREKMRKLWEEELENQDEIDRLEEQNEIIKENKIDEMKKQEQETIIIREKITKEKEIEKQQTLSRLDEINKQKKLAELRKKLKEKQQLVK